MVFADYFYKKFNARELQPAYCKTDVELNLR